MLIFILVKFSLNTFSVVSDWLKIEWQFFSVNEVGRRLLIILVLSETTLLLSQQQQQEDIFSVNNLSRNKQTCSNKRKLRIFHTFSSPTEKRQTSHLFEWSHCHHSRDANWRSNTGATEGHQCNAASTSKDLLWLNPHMETHSWSITVWHEHILVMKHKSSNWNSIKGHLSLFCRSVSTFKQQKVCIRES